MRNPIKRPVGPFLLLLAVTACGSPSDHPSRVPFSGAVNFRDVGGYTTTDGHQVRHDMLYRSDDLSELSRSDLERFSELGLKRVFDLRDKSEKTRNPDRLPDQDSIAVVEVAVRYPPLDRAESRRKILNGEVEDGHFQELMIEANRAFAVNYTAQWSKLLHDMALPNGAPVLIHCTDGKDRTGFAVALILRAVGVPEETIYEDYMLSNGFREHKVSFLAFLGSMGSLFRVPRSEIRPLLEVRREYLEAAFAAIDEEYGSFDAYLSKGLGFDEEALARLRAVMLE